MNVDTFKAKILNPLTYNILNYLDKNLGKGNKLDPKVSNKLFELVLQFVENDTATATTKNKKIAQNYYIINKLLKTLFDSNLELSKILKPNNDQSAILLTKYLIPFLDVFNQIHPERKEYNKFVYDYMFDSMENVSKNYEYLYIIKNIDKPNRFIDKMKLLDTLNYTNQYILTITGCCFTKHEDHIGLFTDTLRNLKILRNEYKKEMFKHVEGSELFSQFNSKQLAIKVSGFLIH